MPYYCFAYALVWTQPNVYVYREREKWGWSLTKAIRTLDLQNSPYTWNINSHSCPQFQIYLWTIWTTDDMKYKPALLAFIMALCHYVPVILSHMTWDSSGILDTMLEWVPETWLYTIKCYLNNFTCVNSSLPLFRKANWTWKKIIFLYDVSWWSIWTLRGGALCCVSCLYFSWKSQQLAFGFLEVILMLILVCFFPTHYIRGGWLAALFPQELWK